ncbi:MAG: BrnT family toxin [bacterium]|nr:BrnT family toxin [bacterium]
MQFEWDESKNLANQRNHGLSFEEARQLFESGVDYLEIFDAEHSDDEDRFYAIGPIRRGIVLVVWVDRGEDIVRIISARMATRRESELFRARARDL